MKITFVNTNEQFDNYYADVPDKIIKEGKNLEEIMEKFHNEFSLNYWEEVVPDLEFDNHKTVEDMIKSTGGEYYFVVQGRCTKCNCVLNFEDRRYHQRKCYECQAWHWESDDEDDEEYKRNHCI